MAQEKVTFPFFFFLCFPFFFVAYALGPIEEREKSLWSRWKKEKNEDSPLILAVLKIQSCPKLWVGSAARRPAEAGRGRPAPDGPGRGYLFHTHVEKQ